MSMDLWTGTDEAINLGNPFVAYASFAEMAHAAAGATGWEELFAVPGFAESGEVVGENYLRKVSDQAGRFRKDFADRLSVAAKDLLDQLSGVGGENK